ncbi:TPA: ion transporter, partial [Streptococcus pneumoniae]
MESKESKNLKKKWFFVDYYDTTIILLALISVILVLLGFAEMIDLDNP